MADGSRTKPCLFSPISGTITFKGEPAAGAKLTRTAGKAHTHGRLVDTAITDNQGQFEMPGVFEKVLLAKFLPMEFVAAQEIVVEFEGNSYKVWAGVKREREVNSESSGRPLVVACELTDEPKRASVGGGFVNSVCTWDFDPDPERDYSNPFAEDE
ncbi:MAG TPA: DUF6795 domain-containing protein [Marinagarivorans sp.]